MQAARLVQGPRDQGEGVLRGSLPNLDRLVTTLQSHGQRIADECAIRVAAHAPVGQGPMAGRLRDDIHGTAEMTATGVHITVISGVPEAAFVIEGTSPHPIDPVNKKALMWPGAAHPVRHVNHPGTQPNPFGEQAKDEIVDVLQAEWSLIVQEMAVS